LVIAKRLVEAMGGKIWVNSVAGAGTSFFFTLFTKATCSRHRVHFLALGSISKKIARFSSSMMAKLIVAFCASRPNAGEWSRKYLEKPAEVLSWLKGGPQVDVAILDLQMPVVDGCQLAREIHSFEKYKGVPLILLSSSLPSRGMGINSVDEFAVRLMKPIKQADLFNALTTALGKIKTVTKSLRQIKKNPRSRHGRPSSTRGISR
jgi:two-component system sensor histidine kinase/response regulator